MAPEIVLRPMKIGDGLSVPIAFHQGVLMGVHVLRIRTSP